MERQRLTIRLPDDCRDYLAGVVLEKRQKGLKWDQSMEIITAIRQRMISKMTKADRERLYRRLNVATGRTRTDETDQI
jgi:hypothetical protein